MMTMSGAEGVRLTHTSGSQSITEGGQGRNQAESGVGVGVGGRDLTRDREGMLLTGLLPG